MEYVACVFYHRSVSMNSRLKQSHLPNAHHQSILQCILIFGKEMIFQRSEEEEQGIGLKVQFFPDHLVFVVCHPDYKWLHGSANICKTAPGQSVNVWRGSCVILHVLLCIIKNSVYKSSVSRESSSISNTSEQSSRSNHS